MKLLLSLLVVLAQVPSDADVKKAETKLAANVDDPEANLTLGRYLAFVKNDWDKALPYLSKSSDAVLKSVLEKERDDIKSGPELVGMGDEWISAAKKCPKYKKEYEERATFWYSKAWPMLDDIWKLKLRDRAHKLSASVKPGSSQKKTPAGWMTETHPKAWPQPASDGLFAHTGSFSVKFPARDPKTENSFVVFSSDLVVISGKEIELSAYVLTEGTDSGQDHLEARFYDKTGKLMEYRLAGLIPIDQPFWTKIETKLSIPAEAIRVQFAMVIMSKTGSAWLDDASIKLEGRELLKNAGFEGQ